VNGGTIDVNQIYEKKDEIKRSIKRLLSKRRVERNARKEE